MVYSFLSLCLLALLGTPAFAKGSCTRVPTGKPIVYKDREGSPIRLIQLGKHSALMGRSASEKSRGELHVLDLKTGKVQTFGDPDDHLVLTPFYPVDVPTASAARLSPDEKWAAAYGTDQKNTDLSLFHLFNTASGQSKKITLDLNKAVKNPGYCPKTQVNFSQDSKWISRCVTGTSWILQRLDPPKDLAIPADTYWTSFVGNGKFAAIATKRNQFQIYDLKKGTAVVSGRLPSDCENFVSSSAESPYGGTFYLSCKSHLYLWDLKTGKKTTYQTSSRWVVPTEIGDTPWMALPSPDHRYFRVIHRKTGKIHEVFKPKDATRAAVEGQYSLQKDGKTLLIARNSAGGYSHSFKEDLVRLDLETGKIQTVLDPSMKLGHPESDGHHVRLSPDGK